MSIEEFEATLRWTEQLAVIQLRGELRSSGGETLENAYHAAGAGHPRAIALDFSTVGYINSTGIALIVSILDRARWDGIPVLAWGLSEHYREIFAITRLVDYITVVADEAAALRVTTR